MSPEGVCACGSKDTLIFSCSGGADVGAVADLAARSLTRQGAGRMFCLAGIGGRVPGVLKTTAQAGAVLAIDGCPLDCARRSLEEAGFTAFRHLRLTDLGMEKGKSPADPDRVAAAVEQAKGLLGA